MTLRGEELFDMIDQKEPSSSEKGPAFQIEGSFGEDQLKDAAGSEPKEDLYRTSPWTSDEDPNVVYIR